VRPESAQLLEVLVLRSGDVGRIAAVIARLEGVEFDAARIATPAPPPSAARPKTGAERTAAWRESRRHVTASPVSQDASHVTEVTSRVTSPVTAERHASPLSSSPSLSVSPEVSNGSESETEERDARDVTSPGDVTTVTVTEPVRPNATGDGAFGMLVDSWADGIRSVTGSHFPSPRGRAGGHLSEILRTVCAGANDACVAARVAGAEYARANAGRTLSPFNFGDWLGSGKPTKAGGPQHPVQPTGAGGKRLWKVGGSAT